MSALVLAVPSKGRLQENAAAFFARAGLPFARGGARDYRGRVEGVADVEIAFLSASEIAQALARGQAHLGVTGEDLLREHVLGLEPLSPPAANGALLLLAPLGFGHSDVVVAVPRGWIDVSTLADLDDVAEAFRARHGRRMRVATKYRRLTREFLARAPVVDYVVVDSAGATEGAPAAGAAEIIVDITSSGATLHANDLKRLEDGTILRSEAWLAAAPGADWSEAARLAARTVLGRIAAEEDARTTREVRALGLAMEGVAAVLASFDAREIANGESGLVATVASARAAPLAEALVSLGATRVSVHVPEAVFAARNALWERLAAGLPTNGA